MRDPLGGELRSIARQGLAHNISISMTVDVYGHLVPGANRAAMDRLPTVDEFVEEEEKAQ